ncbi:MAG TPA: beta-ketoacyl synthase N-terminal-like domain-containing protein, partial [Archangium sp.]|nr:beta-ketoacyl synthase N-terminal-like domain-containing protein [Archangium sp.]
MSDTASPQRSALKQALLAIDKLQSRLDTLEHARTEPVAIIGMACRFPGATTPESFWRLLREGSNAITEVPAERFDVGALYAQGEPRPGQVSSRWGGFLEGVERFDAAFFGISPREAEGMDPQQRLLLEVAWEALEAAGQVPSRLMRSRTGVFVGLMSHDYLDLLREQGGLERIDLYAGTGNAASAAAGRLSYFLGLQGPSVAVDTACSSSLVAVHLACQSLRGGESDMALAGGVNVILRPDATVMLSQARALSPQGQCKAFDASADGFVRSEGCGVVVLKRLSAALAEGEPILAVIRGSAVNQDGRSSGLTVPNGLAQQELLRQALANARVAAADLSYVEAHGTGTALGDPIEVQALGAVLGEGRPADRPLRVGSVKTNVGHMEAAAGMGSLLKVVLALQHAQVPPSLHLRTPNPQLGLEQWPVRVPTTLEPWEGPRLAGVSGFSLSGTNAHLVVAGAPERPAPARAASGGPWVLPLSARTPQALEELARRYQQLLAGPGAPDFQEVCFTASTRRAHHRLGHHPVRAPPGTQRHLHGEEGGLNHIDAHQRLARLQRLEHPWAL